MWKVRNEVKIGLIAAIVIALTLVGLNYLNGSQFFGARLQLTAEYQNSMGLVKGNPVFINGFQVGKVSEVKLDLQKGLILATFDLDEYHPIPVNAEAMIYSADLLGAKAVKIVMPEQPSRELVEMGSRIRGTLEEGLLDVAAGIVENEGVSIMVNVANVTNKLSKLMDRSQKLLDEQYDEKSLVATMENIRATTESLKLISQELRGVAKRVDQIAVDAGQVVATVKDERGEITQIIRNVNTTTDSLALVSGNLSRVIRQVDGATASADEMLRKIDQGQGSLGLLVNDRTLYDSLAVTTGRLNTLLEEVNKNPRKFFDDFKIYLIERKKE